MGGSIILIIVYGESSSEVGVGGYTYACICGRVYAKNC